MYFIFLFYCFIKENICKYINVLGKEMLCHKITIYSFKKVETKKQICPNMN